MRIVLGMLLCTLMSCYASNTQSPSSLDEDQISCVVTGDICLQYRHQPDEEEKEFLRNLCKGRAVSRACDRRYYDLDCKKDITYEETNRTFRIALFERKGDKVCGSIFTDDELDGIALQPRD
jgi:hypothetical protein